MSACNDHCQDCPFACHSEAEDGHTPEWLRTLQVRVNRMLEPRNHYSIPQTFVAGVDR